VIELKTLVSKAQKPEVKVVNVNGTNVTVKQYLSYQEKLKLISNIINLLTVNSTTDFLDPVSLDLYMTLEIVEGYTDIKYPEEESLGDIYDFLIKNGILKKIMNEIPQEEINFISSSVIKMLEENYKFENSFKGVIKYFIRETEGMAEKTQELQKKLANTENLELVKNIVDKLG
jgi:hypothetical protein